MSVFCSDCGREYDITLFQYGRTIECTCGTSVGREFKVLSIKGGSSESGSCRKSCLIHPIPEVPPGDPCEPEPEEMIEE